MLKNKKAKGNTGQIFAICIVIVIAALLIGTGVFFGLRGQTVRKEGEVIIAGEDGVKEGEVVTVAGCPDTFKHPRVQVFDYKSTASTQLAGTGYLYDENGKYISSITVTDSGYSAPTSGLCGKYKFYFPTVRGANASAESELFSVTFNDHYEELQTNQLDYLKTRVKYVDTDAYGYVCTGGTTSACVGNSSSFSEMNTSSIYTDTAQTAKAIGTDGELNLQIHIKTNTARKYFNEIGKPLWMCVDLGSNNYWDEPTVAIAGNALENKKTQINANDQVFSYVSNSEYCYLLSKDITSTDVVINYDGKTRSGQDPGTADSPILYFLPEGTFKSVNPATKDKILQGIVTDAATQALVVPSSAYVPSLEIQVS